MSTKKRVSELSLFVVGLAVLIAQPHVAQGQYVQVQGDRYITWVGAATSQGDGSMNADTARSTYGLDGSGIRIGVISDSFNGSGSSPTMAQQIAAGDLPGPGNPGGYYTPVTVVKDDIYSDEGRALLEIVHDIAPGAQLYFHSAFNNPGAVGSPPSTPIANAIDALVAQGVDIIIDDVFYLDEARFQDGAAAQAVDAAKASGVAYFSSAGNSDNNATRHQFNGPSGSTVNFGTNDVLEFYFPGGTAYLSVQWTDPYQSVSGPEVGGVTDFEVDVTNAAGTITYFTVDYNGVGDDPYEFFGIQGPSGIIGLRIRHNSGSTDDLVQVSMFDGIIITDVDDTNEGALNGHAAADGAVAVAAHRWSDLTNVEWFSSLGPTDIFFDAAGNPVSQTRQTPGITAPDGVSTTTSGFSSFYGTSAAAPHAAAVAALMLERADDLGLTMSVDDIYDTIFSTAVDMGTAGFDNVSGWGRIDALAAVEAVPEPTTASLLALCGLAMLRRRRNRRAQIRA